MYSDEENPQNNQETEFLREEDDELKEYERRSEYDDDDEDEEEEDDEEQLAQVREGFIVDDDEMEEEEEDGSDLDRERIKKKKKQRKRRSYEDEEEELDEDDLALVEENLGISKSRMEQKHKRLKRGRVYESEEESDRERRVSQSKRKESFPRRNQYDARRIFEDDYEEYQDDMNDFIADDEELEDEYAEKRRKQRQKQEERKRQNVASETGIDAEIWEEIFELFGDGEDYAFAMYEEMIPDSYQDKKETDYQDIFEPGLLVDKMLTQEDENIRASDIPERIQLRSGPTEYKRLLDSELEQQVMWVSKMFMKQKNIDVVPDQVKKAIHHVLTAFSQEFLEVPFVHRHRQDYISELKTSLDNEIQIELLGSKDLWLLSNLDLKYRSFQERKTNLYNLMEKLGILDDTYVMKIYQNVEKIEDISDLTDYIHLHYNHKVTKMNKNSGLKRPSKNNPYEICKRSNLGDFIKNFGLTTQEFATNMAESTKHYFPEDNALPVDDLLREFVGSQFREESDVRKAVITMIAYQISYDPQIRSVLREKYLMSSLISTHATERGHSRIDQLHPYFYFKYITAKPIREFHDGTFLSMLKAEEEGLIQMSFELENKEEYFEFLLQLLSSDHVSDIAQSWNELRKDCLKAAFDNHLNFFLEKYLREHLKNQAEEWVCLQAQQSFEMKLLMGPCFPPKLKSEPEPIPRVLTITHGDYEEVIIVTIDFQGNLLEHHRYPNLKDEYEQRFLKLVETRYPDTIGISGSGMALKRVFDSVCPLINDYCQQKDEDIRVLIANDEVAKLYKDSNRAVEEFPHLPSEERYLIGLARYLQSPVHEYAALGKDLALIQHHSLQHLVNDEKLLFYLENSLVDVVSDMGVNVNEAAELSHRSHTLQYACGLGPRKAETLLKKITANNGSLETRADLIKQRLVTKNIFINCASFIRIKPPFDVLDDTRIHPSDYDLARKMAADALDIDMEDDEHDEVPSQQVSELMSTDPKLLHELNLDAYAEELLRRYKKPKRITLNLIKEELLAPYRDKRGAFVPPSDQQVFTMFTGETPETLYPGALVEFTVHRIQRKVAFGRLASGLDASLPIQNVAEHRVEDISEYVLRDDTIECAVVNLDTQRLSVELSMKPSEVVAAKDLRSNRVKVDPHFDGDLEQKDREVHVQIKTKKTAPKRMIPHPFFKPFSYPQSEEYLSKKPKGEVIVRPSSRGNSHITISWKLDEDIYKHLDVLELDKEDEMSLGKVLMIKEYATSGEQEYKFSDLDELIVSYVEPFSRKMDQIIEHPKFHTGSLDNLSQTLSSLQETNPKLSVYGFCLNSDRPGRLFLGFKINAKTKMKSMDVIVRHDGYILNRKFQYPNVQALINGFKSLNVNVRKDKPSSHSNSSTSRDLSSRPARHRERVV